MLVIYDGNQPLKSACDASPYGVGAGILHIMDNGEERPIAIASCTLMETEKEYAQIEREALSIIYGVRKFHKYIYGRKFTLTTDHKPLLPAIPTLAALQMQRWVLVLMAYNYNIEYRKSADHMNADAMSRLLTVVKDCTGDEGNVFYFSQVDDLPVSARDIAQATRKDPTLCKVWNYTVNSWPNYMSEEN